ncbi:MAG: universal stress protein, partial [Treponema sp.]|nr:universal stress protein [Treponema sp.]
MKDFVKKILVAINGTENSIHAAMYAIMLAKSYNAQLKFIYVVDSATVRYLGINKVLIQEDQPDFTPDLNSEGQTSL